MKAILLSAGYGKRLKSLTKNNPKCLLPINKKPILKIWIENLVNNNIKDILVNTHYLNIKVENFIKNSMYKEFVTTVYENQLRGTAGTLFENIEFCENSEVMLIHCDNYFPRGISEFLFAHKNRPSKALLTMLTFSSPNPSLCGIVELDKNKFVINLHEKVENPPGDIANGAVYVLSKEFIKEIKKNNSKFSDFILDIIPNYYGRIFTYHTNETFIDIGSQQNYKKANLLAKKFYSN